METAGKVFDGGVDWEGTYVDEEAPNLLTDLPAGHPQLPRLRRLRAVDPNSTAAKNIRRGRLSAGPRAPAAASLWTNYSNSFWEVTACQWQKRLDPTYDTYGAGLGNYNYVQRRTFSDVGGRLSDFATTGDIQKPLITVAGTMDALLPIDHHARAYARRVAEMRDVRGARDKSPAYRLYEVQNGNHIETYKSTFPQLEFIEPHAQAAFTRPREARRGRRAAAAQPVHPARRRHRRGACAAGPLREPARSLSTRGVIDGRPAGRPFFCQAV